ncbi:Uma2 family endonuclease [Stratiformator vulcanicus]|uniref:Putative restriction endonuclease domain-containing protein n=1 Tax=Stratiformator vulcanicus TaxID=2527980 RepID=A0A517QVL7_9PLAN|nr:Uma2 family endonuclease [Stratiformator vulcanicus]QDT35699.1 hypothetical protein Pan189_00520 [Stratiformator vulcanicus]
MSTSRSIDDVIHHPRPGEPAYFIAEFWPDQGRWSEEAYFRLPKQQGVELVDGRLEMLAVPTTTHQRLMKWVFRLLMISVDDRGLGETFPAGLRVRIRAGNVREPDVVVVLNRRPGADENRALNHADLAVEVVSPSDPDRDWVEKHRDYAEAGISEYWIVDPRDRTLTIFSLDEAGVYQQAGRCASGQTARSTLLPDVTVVIDELFACVGE